MGTMPLTNEIDLVDPTLSQRRQWLCRQLAILLPNNVITLASNDPKTSAFFKDWTGQTQKNLEEDVMLTAATSRFPVQPRRRQGYGHLDGLGPSGFHREGLGLANMNRWRRQPRRSLSLKVRG